MLTAAKRFMQKRQKHSKKEEYRFFNNSAYSMLCFAVTLDLCSMIYKGLSKKYIKQRFEDICFICDMPEIFGKKLDMSTTMEMLEKDYGICRLQLMDIKTKCLHSTQSSQKANERR